MFGTEQFFKSQHMGLLCRDEACSVYQMRNETGDGVATFYPVYPGISVMYSDFHMTDCPPRRFEKSRFINIHHCLEGRVESEVSNGTYIYLEPGDTMIENFSMEHQYCSFPLCHFHGVVITIAVEEALAGMQEFLELFKINLNTLESAFAFRERPFILHGHAPLDRLFSELYQIPGSIKREYLRVKVLELLLELKAMDFDTVEAERPYFYKTQIEKVKAIQALMTEHPDYHYTMEELANRFDLSVSSLKLCFKGVYGVAIYTYMRNYRMNMAATLLTQTEKSIAEIAGQVGYSNSSKFARAFKEVKGVTPVEFRKVTI